MSRKQREPLLERPEEAEEVGYRKPPKHTRFKPGQSGNPKGRPPRHQNLKTVLSEALSKRVVVRDGSGERSLTRLEVVVLALLNGATKLNPRAIGGLIALMRATGLDSAHADDTEPAHADLTSEDEELLRDFLRRSRPPERGGKS